jgi:hypothetical protein
MLGFELFFIIVRYKYDGGRMQFFCCCEEGVLFWLKPILLHFSFNPQINLGAIHPLF